MKPKEVEKKSTAKSTTTKGAIKPVTKSKPKSISSNLIRVETKSRDAFGILLNITLDLENKAKLDKLIKNAGSMFKGIYVSYSKITGNYTVYFKTVKNGVVKSSRLKNLLVDNKPNEYVLVKNDDGLNLTSQNLEVVDRISLLKK